MIKKITTTDLSELMKKENIQLIDIREQEERAEGYAKSSVHIPMNHLLMNPDHYLNQQETYYIICRSGRRSEMLCQYLNELEYDVVDVLGGHLAWPNPLEQD
jgi:rhodanese-related sulfurtransferase